jgi:Putative prokaryotic signal transducing protein
MNPSASLPFLANARSASESQADEEPPHGEFVTVTRVFNSLEAEMLRGCLEAEGIPATLGDAQTIQTDTLLTVALGGIRVMVPASFAEAARQTVEAFERGALAIDELPDDAEPVAPEAEVEQTAGFRMSPLAWAVVVIIVVAVVIF